MSKLSVVINTKNAESTLDNCLKSVEFADEIVITDMQSTDKTVEIAKQYTDNIFAHEDVGYADPARNFALSKASYDWILVIDADEVVPVTLKEKIIALIESPSADVYLIPRQNYIFNQAMEHTGWWPDYQPRLFKQGHVSWEVGVHRYPELTGTVEELQPKIEFALIHQNYPNVSSYLARMDRYTSLQAKEKLKYARQVNPSTLTTSFFSELWKRLFVLDGYQDETVGVGLSLLQASYELIVKLKIWELQKHPNSTESADEILNQFTQVKSDLAYYLADYKVKETQGLTKLYWRLRRKYKL